MATMAIMSGANGCSIGVNGDSVSGANGDHNRHWRRLIHSMAILSSQSPFIIIWRSNGANGFYGTIDDNGDSFGTMAPIAPSANIDDGDLLVPNIIRWRQWR